MVGWQWFVLVLIVILALAVTNWQRTQTQVKALQQAGFSISEDLKGQPQLLVDSSAQEIALVDSKGFQRQPFSTVSSVELRFDNNSQVQENFRLQITLKSGAAFEIHYENEWLARDQLSRFKTLLQL